MCDHPREGGREGGRRETTPHNRDTHHVVRQRPFLAANARIEKRRQLPNERESRRAARKTMLHTEAVAHLSEYHHRHLRERFQGPSRSAHFAQSVLNAARVVRERRQAFVEASEDNESVQPARKFNMEKRIQNFKKRSRITTARATCVV